MTDKAVTDIYRIGVAAQMVGVSSRKLQYHCMQSHIDYTLIKRSNRTFFGFTDKQVSDAIFYFKIRGQKIQFYL